MGILFEQEVINDDDIKKPFIIVLEKYKKPVVINSINVSEDDECNLEIDFNHEIEGVSSDEIADELGRIILEKIETGLKFDTTDMKVEKE